jgi:hypothetical protein
MNPGKKTFLVLVFLFVFSCGFAWYCASRPHLDWDMIAYVASAMRYENDDPTSLQQNVYNLLKRTVPPQTYKELTDGYQRHTRATDPESLRQHLPFYRIRVLYIGGIYLLFKLGMNPFVASYLISVVCVTLCIWFIAFLFPWKTRLLYLVLVPIIVIASRFDNLARYSTPDGLAVLSVVASYWLLLRRNRLLLVLLPMSVLVRTDLLILVFFFLGYLIITKKFEKRFVIVSALFSIGIYFLVNWYFGNYGWSTLIYYSFIERVTHPATMVQGFSLKDYLNVLVKGTRKAIGNMQLPFAFSIGILVSYMLFTRREIIKKRLPGKLSDLTFLLLSSALYFGAHFILFPGVASRFFAGQYAIVACLLVYLITTIIPSKESSQITKTGSSGGLR